MPTLSFKVSAAEARAIRRKVRAEKTTVSAFLRESALGRKPARRRVVIKKHPVSGLLFDASPGPVVTSEQINAALADFP